MKELEEWLDEDEDCPYCGEIWFFCSCDEEEELD